VNFTAHFSGIGVSYTGAAAAEAAIMTAAGYMAGV